MRAFINDVVNPWNRLNARLALPFAYQPELSDVTREAKSLAVAIKHTAEHMGFKNRDAIDKQSPANRLMSDIADGWKHGQQKLWNQKRRNAMHVASRFEINSGGEVRFLRNRVVIQHDTLGELDFMVSARDAIRYWLSQTETPINWPGFLLEGPPEFLGRSAVLYFDPSQQVDMSQLSIETVQRNSNGKVAAFDTSELSFALMDFHHDSFSQLGPPIECPD